MLVLSRKRNESVVIGDDIEVFVVEIRGDKVRLGFNAPKTMLVNRREVYDAINRVTQEIPRGSLSEAAKLESRSAALGRLEDDAAEVANTNPESGST